LSENGRTKTRFYYSEAKRGIDLIPDKFRFHNESPIRRPDTSWSRRSKLATIGLWSYWTDRSTSRVPARYALHSARYIRSIELQKLLNLAAVIDASYQRW